VDFGRVAKRARDVVLAKPTNCGTSDDAEQYFSCRFLKETLAPSNSAEAVMVFWRNEQIRGTDEPAEAATIPGAAFSCGFLDETDDFRNEHVTLFLRNGRICRTDKFAERALCGTSNDDQRSAFPRIS